MIETPTIVETGAKTTASIPLTVPTSEIMSVMGPGIQEIYSVLAAQGIEPAGPWLTHHFKQPSDVFDFEICVPTSTTVTPSGRVRPGSLRATTAARTVLTGPYSELPEAWGEFMSWIEGKQLSVAPDLWEVYVLGPEAEEDASKWRTELYRPLA